MKKRFLSLILTISIMLSALAGISVSAAETEVIGGSSIEIATELELDTKYMSVLDDAVKDQKLADVDWYKFTTEENNAYYRFEFAHYTGDGKYFVLCTYSEKELYRRSLYSNNSDIEYILLDPNETYYIKVYHANAYNGTGGKYGINVTYCPDDYKNNIDEAEKISVNDTIRSSIECSDDLDYFTFNDAEDGIYTFEITAKSGISQCIRVFDSDGEELEESWLANVGETKTVEVQLQFGETYYVEISGYVSILNVDGGGEYVMSIYATGCKHSKTSKNNYVTEYEEIRGDENNHYIIKYYDEICDECGATIEEKVQDSKYSERHDFSGDYCSDCGFEKEAESLPIVQEPTDTPSDYEDKETEEKYYMAYSFEARNLDNLLTPKEGKANINREQWTGDTFEFTAVTSQDVDEISICGDKPDDTYWHEIPYSYLRENYLLGYVDNDDGTRTWTCQFSIHEIGYRAFMLKINGYETGFITYLTLHENKGSFSPTPQQGEISVLIDGKGYVNFDVPPQIINGRTMLPVRAVAEALGGYADWDEDTKTASIACYAKDNVEKSCDIIIGSTSMYWEEVGGWIYGGTGGYKELDSPAVIIDGRTLVPFRAIAEVFGYDVEWNDSTRTVTIK